MVGFDTADDAGVYLIRDDLALIQSVDFFTPVVDDPFTYGQIAAANALSDIYAMGGVPLFAVSIVCFPPKGVDEEILAEIIAGGTEKMREAGTSVIGGHSVQDPEIKFGYCVTGTADPKRIWTNASAQVGDVLLLTKPLGTGIISTGIKFGRAADSTAAEAIKWMLRLNGDGLEVLRRYPVSAATDITGFGLIGHAYEMARASDKTLLIRSERVPLIEGTEALARQGMLPAGIKSNRRYVEQQLHLRDVPELQEQILLDPQTSGGLLVSVPGRLVDQITKELRAQDLLAEEIGNVLPREKHLVVVNRD